MCDIWTLNGLSVHVVRSSGGRAELSGNHGWCTIGAPKRGWVQLMGKQGPHTHTLTHRHTRKQGNAGQTASSVTSHTEYLEWRLQKEWPDGYPVTGVHTKYIHARHFKWCHTIKRISEVRPNTTHTHARTHARTHISSPVICVWGHDVLLHWAQDITVVTERTMHQTAGFSCFSSLYPVTACCCHEPGFS